MGGDKLYVDESKQLSQNIGDYYWSMLKTNHCLPRSTSSLESEKWFNDFDNLPEELLDNHFGDLEVIGNVEINAKHRMQDIGRELRRIFEESRLCVSLKSSVLGWYRHEFVGKVLLKKKGHDTSLYISTRSLGGKYSSYGLQCSQFV